MYKTNITRFILRIFIIALFFCFNRSLIAQTETVISSNLKQKVQSSVQATKLLAKSPKITERLMQQLKAYPLSDRIKSVSPISATILSSQYKKDLKNILVSRYEDIYGKLTGHWADSLISAWNSQKSYIVVLKWQLLSHQKTLNFNSLAIFNKDGTLRYDPIVANITTTLSISSIKSAQANTINPKDTKTVQLYATITNNLGGSVTLNWKVKVTAEVSPYIAPITNDGSFAISSDEITTWRSNPSGISPSGVPVVVFGTNGTIGDENKPYESPITINGFVDHFKTGTCTSTFDDGNGMSPMRVSFSIRYKGIGLSISLPTDNTDPIVLGTPDNSGRKINILNKVFRHGLLGKYRGIFWNGGSFTFNNFIVGVEDGGTEKGTISATIPIQCVYRYWKTEPQLQIVGFGGNINLNVGYVRGNKIPDPVCTMTATKYNIGIGQQTTVNVRVKNPSSVVAMDNGNINLSTSSLGGKLSVIGSATKSLGTIPAGEYKDYSFTLQGSSTGTPRPQATVSGRWGWPAGDAGKRFSVPTSLDNNIEVGNAPTPNFSASPTSGKVPLTVNFTDKSTGNPTSWSWDFGDGYTSANQNTSHTYQNAGNYTVKLTASNQYGKNTETKTDFIIVNSNNDTNSTLWKDDFDNDKLNNFPDKWLYSGNGETSYVTNEKHVSSPNSLSVQGVSGGDWEGLVHREYNNNYKHYIFKFDYLYTGQGEVGVHLTHGIFSITSDPTWTTSYRRVLIYFDTTMEIRSYPSLSIIGNYKVNTWVDVKIDYQVLSDSVKIKYFINNNFVHLEEDVIKPGEDQLKYVTLESGDTRCLFDNVAVYLQDITGLAEQEALTGKITIMPNPNSGAFVIKSERKIQKIEVINQNGVVVFKKNDIGHKATVNLQTVKGIYLIKITVDTGNNTFSTAIKKLIIQ